MLQQNAGGQTRAYLPDGKTALTEWPDNRFAVDLRQPYRWRVQETMMTGEIVNGPWVTSDSWTEIIDASGPIFDEGPEPPGNRTDLTTTTNEGGIR